MTSHTIPDVETLRTLYAAPGERAVKKQIGALDRHAARFIELSPFVVLASSGAAGSVDASPRGGAAGFVKAPDAHTLLLPDAPGNNRLDSLSNIIETGRVGLLFLIPGFDETLRVNGRAELSLAAADIARCTDEKRAPKLVIRVAVQEVYLHCAKAFMRSELWKPESWPDRASMPTLGEILRDQLAVDQSAAETDRRLDEAYKQTLW